MPKTKKKKALKARAKTPAIEKLTLADIDAVDDLKAGATPEQVVDQLGKKMVITADDVERFRKVKEAL